VSNLTDEEYIDAIEVDLQAENNIDVLLEGKMRDAADSELSN
ncbi:hypothetical protein WICPIJ_009217, partial [Wickerhamomyces pijperi]